MTLTMASSTVPGGVPPAGTDPVPSGADPTAGAARPARGPARRSTRTVRLVLSVGITATAVLAVLLVPLFLPLD
ncbi:ABC transporter permease, partial [Streptomyces alkaliphilus]|nr:ABC transporter permease [Streptomyces alkaliphilus]